MSEEQALRLYDEEFQRRERAETKAAAAQVALGMASEEVRELRAELAEHRRALAAAQQAIRELPVITDEMEAEVAKLTEALRRIEASDYKTTWALRGVARAALSPGKVPE